MNTKKLQLEVKTNGGRYRTAARHSCRSAFAFSGAWGAQNGGSGKVRAEAA